MKTVTYSDINQRKMVLESATPDHVKANCKLYRQSAYYTPDKDNILKFIKECAKSAEMSLKYHRDIENLINMYTEKTNLHEDDIIDAYLESCKLLPSDYSVYRVPVDESIIEKNRICDRVLSNHNHMNESFSIEETARKNIHNPEILANKVCDIVDKFKLPLHGKVCVALEEFQYLVDKNQIVTENMTDTVLKYFLMKENSYLYIDKIAKSLRSSLILESDMTDTSSSDIVDSFVAAPIKNTELLESTLEDIMRSPAHELINHLTEFLKMVREILISGTDDLSDGAYQKVIPNIYELFYQNRLEDPEAKTMVSDIITVLSGEIAESKIYISNYNDPNVESYFVHYSTALQTELDKFMELNDSLYPKYNIECMHHKLSESGVVMTLDEAKLFKHENLLTVIKNVDDAIAARFKVINQKAKDKMHQIRKKIFGESSIYEMFDSNGAFDYTLSIYESTGKIDHNEISDLCKFINESVLNEYAFECYYVQVSENTCEFHLKSDDFYMNIDEMYDFDTLDCVPEDIKYYIESLLEYADMLPDEVITEEALEEFVSNIKEENQLRDFIELCSISGINEDLLSTAVHKNHYISESVKERYMNKYQIESVDDNIRLESFCCLNALICEGVNTDLKRKLKIKANGDTYGNTEDFTNSGISSNKEETVKEASEEDKKEPEKDNKKNGFVRDVKALNNKKPEDNKKPENKPENEKKNPFAGINLNSIELYLQGLRKKMKDMSAKEKELSRQIDTAFSMFVKSVKNCLVSDRREAIIKGSVIPSFSKCIKISIAVAGIAAINVPAAIITVMGGLAASKRLTQKERSLLLDEIEVELEIIDKEINAADSKGQMKKLRALMREKKNLQRQYQSIKYNIRIGKDIVPTSVGTPKGDR